MEYLLSAFLGKEGPKEYMINPQRAYNMIYWIYLKLILFKQNKFNNRNKKFNLHVKVC